MKRILCIFFALVCILSLTSCKNGEDETDTAATASTEETVETGEPTELTGEMIDAVMAWREVKSWSISSSAAMTMVDDGDTENAQGYMVAFDGSMIEAEKGNMYYGTSYAVNSVFAFDISYEMYYYDGWGYQIYTDPEIEELNTYERYQTTEDYFRADHEGIVPTLASEEEFENAEAVAFDDFTVINVTLGEGRARDELLGDIEYLAEYNGVSVEDISIVSAAVSYEIKDGKLAAYMGSYTLEFYVGDVLRQYTMEKSSVINATGDAVESFTLPEDCDSYEVIG